MERASGRLLAGGTGDAGALDAHIGDGLFGGLADGGGTADEVGVLDAELLELGLGVVIQLGRRGQDNGTLVGAGKACRRDRVRVVLGACDNGPLAGLGRLINELCCGLVGIFVGDALPQGGDGGSRLGLGGSFSFRAARLGLVCEGNGGNGAKAEDRGHHECSDSSCIAHVCLPFKEDQQTYAILSLIAGVCRFTQIRVTSILLYAAKLRVAYMSIFG